MLPSLMPPMSDMCIIAPAHRTSSPSTKSGATIAMSGACTEPFHGSLTMNMSPGPMPGFSSQSATTLRTISAMHDE